MIKRLLLVSDNVGTPAPARGILNYSAGLLACCKRLGIETTLLVETTDASPTSPTAIARFLVEGRIEEHVRYRPRWKHVYAKYIKSRLERVRHGTVGAPSRRRIVFGEAETLAPVRAAAPHLAWVDAFMPIAGFYSGGTLRAAYGLRPPVVDARGFHFVLMDAFHYAQPIVDNGAQVILVIHDLILLDELKGRYRLILDHKFQVSLEQAKALIFVSGATRDEFCRRFPDHARRLPSSVLSPVIRPDLLEAAKEHVAGPQAKRPKFVSVLSDEPRKNIALLVETFAQMPNADLVVVGNIAADKYLGQSAPPNIRFVGHVTEGRKAEILGSASALVFPSLSEGFGIPIVEGALFGLPVICSDLAVFHEITSGFATYFDPKSASDLKRQLDQIIANPASFRPKARALKDHCLASYGMDAATTRLAQAFALAPATS